ncbi:glycosyltransferase [Candidatus Nitrospira neomarina]|uniref:Glycosyltransferase n=1 Tax=Candidatus Nitrospira neomarina TaxID=3020899 RepID=A0AA96GU18_9BACT|nr:glycosyltransferase [Candidatus Nitrospira neomarina]WNM64084.1 glycosyltransferase [Candidatus Nitrospira neomarina]
MNYKPAVVVVAFNRPNALQRLLESLNADLQAEAVDLVLSVDYGGPSSVAEIATSFIWKYGKKRVILRDENLGLHKHILACGQLTDEYGSIILLEDDLYISPCFYQYGVQAINFYQNDSRISGISLYAHGFIQTSADRFPFNPIKDKWDVYFMQHPASSGQAWTDKQWSRFMEWYAKNKNGDGLRNLPEKIAAWPESSWKKYFNSYMIAQDKYFVYPYISLTTNFGESGTNMLKNSSFQVPLELNRRKFEFGDIDDSIAVYDTYCELSSDRLSRLCKELQCYDFEVDIYGTKNLKRVAKSYILTSKAAKKRVQGFALELRPAEMNVIMGIKGEDIGLCRKEDVSELPQTARDEFRNFVFFYRISLPVQTWIKYCGVRIWQALKLRLDLSKIFKYLCVTVY